MANSAFWFCFSCCSWCVIGGASGRDGGATGGAACGGGDVGGGTE